MNNLDRIIQSQFPAVMVPNHEPLDQVATNQARLLVAEDGVFIEAKAEWGYFRQLTMPSPRTLPYGHVTETCLISAPPLDNVIKSAIRADAMHWLPDEYAGHVLLQNGQLHYHEAELDPNCSHPRSPTHINYMLPEPEQGDLILDVHSHGHGKPYFSHTDYQDMNGGIYIALVLGRCERGETMIFEYGLNVAGFFFPRLPAIQTWLSGKNQTEE